jgi:CXC domain
MQELLALVHVHYKLKRSMLRWNRILDDLEGIDVSECFVRFCRDDGDDGNSQRMQLMNLYTSGAITGVQFRQLMMSIVTAAEPTVLNHQEDEETAIDYENWTESLRTLFCRPCCRYNCSIHGGTTVKPSARQQMETSLLVEAQRDGKVLSIKMYDIVKRKESHHQQSNQQQPHPQPHQQRLTAFQEAIFGAAYHVCQGNGADVATFLGLPSVALVEDHVQLQCNVTESSVEVPVKKKRISCKGKRWGPFSIRNYRKELYRAACQTEWLSIPYCQPCQHAGDCVTGSNNNNCSCVQHHRFCTVACGHRELSGNFFLGCKCRGDCRTDQCPCRAANRACDPTLCRHQHTNNNKKNDDDDDDDDDDDTSNNIACRNTISLDQGAAAAVELLVARSTIAGYGCFTNQALMKGDYVGECVGELITTVEAKRREALIRSQQNGPQQRGMYFFDLSADLVIDATFCGNETRFINHAFKGYNVMARSTYYLCDCCCIVVLCFFRSSSSFFVTQNPCVFIAFVSSFVCCCSQVCAGLPEHWVLRVPRYCSVRRTHFSVWG